MQIEISLSSLLNIAVVVNSASYYSIGVFGNRLHSLIGNDKDEQSGDSVMSFDIELIRMRVIPFDC
jgi:hypothetical protein